MGALVERQVGHDQAGSVEAAPVAEPDEDQVAHRRGDEAGQQGGKQSRSEADAALDEQHAAHERAAEERGDRGEGAGRRQHRGFPLTKLGEPCDRDGDRRSQRDHRCLGAEHCAERERADGGERDARGV